jgi:hypothetical protein
MKTLEWATFRVVATEGQMIMSGSMMQAGLIVARWR